LRNYTVKGVKSKAISIIRYKEDKYLCLKSHEVIKTGNEFNCRACNEVYKIQVI